jgi:ketosteroid isomerase-like protein
MVLHSIRPSSSDSTPLTLKLGSPAVAGLYELVGRDGSVELMRSFTEGFDDFVFELEEIVDAGNDSVVGVTRWYRTGKEAGCPSRCASVRYGRSKRVASWG